MTYFKPLSMIHDYPSAIQDRVRKLGLIEQDKNKKTIYELIRKNFAILVFALLFALIVYKFNDADTFLKGFCHSYLL